MTKLFTNIKELIQVREPNILKVSGDEMRILPTIKDAYLFIKEDIIIDFGKMDELPNLESDEIIDCTGKLIFPSWCDSHTHIVFAGNREQEFVDRINGLTYQEIAEKGGGILNSAKKLQNTSFDDLYEQSSKRLEEIIKLGTGAVEIKSGYGLTLDAELKILQVIKKLKENYNIPIKATFLGAHAVPKEFKDDKNGYVDLIINEMLPKIAQKKLADFVDIFCEEGYFDTSDTDKILRAASKYNLRGKIHVNQFNSIGGIKTGVANNVLSVDHLEVLTDNDITALKNTNTIPVALPSCSFFLGIPYTPVRKLINENLPLAVATDYNPGSTPSGNMNFVVSLSCIKLKMTPEEAINAATINGAYAMEVIEQSGSITKGKLANFFITKEIPSYAFLPYSFGSNLIESVYLKGEQIS